MKEKIKINIIPKEDRTAAASPLLEETDAPAKKSRKWFYIKIFASVIIFFTTCLAVFSSQVLMSEQSATSWYNRLPVIKQFKYLAESADRQLKGEERNRINIVLLGMGGKNHDGGYLTDTIMLVSLEPSTKKVSLLSIPRDMAVPIEDMGWRKINNVNAFAEKENPGSGGLATCQAISDILNIPVDYFIRADFQGFINIINELGGVDVVVENTLDDYSYPVLGREDAVPYESRYEHLHFDQGPQHMDGETALKYARSRHAAGVEGSDFARARRQQIIMEAVKDNVLSMHILFKPTKIANIIDQMKEHISTNLKIWEMVKLWELFKDVKKEDIANNVLDNSANGLLVNSITPDGAYILLPRNGDFSEIQYLANNVFSEGPKEIKSIILSERATIEIRNGTWINGIANKTSVDLEKLGFTIVRIANSSRQNFEKSVIYDLSYGEKKESLNVLKNKTGAELSAELPEWMREEISQDNLKENKPVQPDFILVIGRDADKSESGTENIKN